MLSEEFDKKVKEAAEHHHPAYDENAWAKMEKLLDKHLPKKKDDRRRIIILLFLFLLAGGGLYLMMSKPWQQGKPVADANKNSQQYVSGIATKDANADNSGKIKPNNTAIDNTIVTQNKNSNEEKKKPATTELYYNNPITSIIIGKPQTKENKTSETTNDPSHAVNNNAGAPVKTDPLKNGPVQKNDKVVIISPTVANNNLTIEPIKNSVEKDKIEQSSTANTIIDSAQKLSADIAAQVAKKAKGHIKKTGSFFLSLSAGPDISFTGLNNPGKTKLLVGAGLGYTFKNRFILRTGFYAARKIYSADPDKYNPPAYSWVSYYKMEKIDADCKVYEIPVSVSYIFKNSKKQSWFGTVGLASYLMKRETYDYLYKNYSGQLVTKTSTLYNENKYFFSVLTLSGGYQLHINNTFSIMAEPYVEVPMKGVGFGKVKLNSAGFLFSVGIRPFGSKNKSIKQTSVKGL